MIFLFIMFTLGFIVPPWVILALWIFAVVMAFGEQNAQR